MHDEMSFLFNKPPKMSIKTDKFGERYQKLNKDNVKNHIINGSYFNDNNDNNPYLEIINKLNGLKSMELNYSDFAYLVDLGVYPVNRLIILRRFDENVMVKNDLNDIDAKPISTLVSWITPDDDDMFSMSFSEKWIDQNRFFWEVISDVVKNNTGMNINHISSLPAWSQGFLYQMLQGAGIGNFDKNGKNWMPVGDPDVLRSSKTRDLNGSISSDIKLSFNSKYEQKYIGGIDSGIAMMTILNNIIRMGISDMKFVLKSDKTLNDLTNSIYSNQGGSMNDWISGIKSIIKSFVETSKNMFGLKNPSDTTDTDKKIYDKTKITEMIKNTLDLSIKRFRWDLKSSLALTTGLPTTPWHVTVGNPLNPILSIGNVVVDQGNIKFGNEFNFNDMPTNFKVSFNIDFGRPLGRSELLEILNINYERNYNNSSNTGDVDAISGA